jgi:hypothetical protein
MSLWCQSKLITWRLSAKNFDNIRPKQNKWILSAKNFEEFWVSISSFSQKLTNDGATIMTNWNSLTIFWCQSSSPLISQLVSQLISWLAFRLSARRCSSEVAFYELGTILHLALVSREKSFSLWWLVANVSYVGMTMAIGIFKGTWFFSKYLTPY